MLSFKRFLADESGATAIEYGIIAALQTLSGNLQNTFNYVGNQLSSATTTTN